MSALLWPNVWGRPVSAILLPSRLHRRLERGLRSFPQAVHRVVASRLSHSQSGSPHIQRSPRTEREVVKLLRLALRSDGVQARLRRYSVGTRTFISSTRSATIEPASPEG